MKIPSRKAGGGATSGGASAAHPGTIDRCCGDKIIAETGPSNPAYLPTKKGRRRGAMPRA